MKRATRPMARRPAFLRAVHLARHRLRRQTVRDRLAALILAVFRSGASWACAAAAVVAAAAALQSADDGLRATFALGAVALVYCAASLHLGSGVGRAVRILQVLTAGTFALSVAEVGSRSALEPGRYHSLWLPCVLAAIAVIADIGHRGWIGSEPSARR